MACIPPTRPGGQSAEARVKMIHRFSVEQTFVAYTLPLLRLKLNGCSSCPWNSASKDACLASVNNDSVFSGGREAQRVGRSHVCHGTSKTFREKVILGLSPQNYVGVREGDPSRQREQHEHKYGGMKLQGHWERSASRSNPMVILDHRLGRLRTFPPPG